MVNNWPRVQFLARLCMHFNVLLHQQYVYFHLYQQFLMSFETLISVYITSLATRRICINANELAACEQEVDKQLYYAWTTIVTLAEWTLIWEFHGNTPIQVSIVCLQVEKSVG